MGLSVSRVGGAAQIKAMKDVAGLLRIELAQFRELESFAQFGADLEPSTKKKLVRGRVLVEVLKQRQYEPLSVGMQVIQLYAAINGWLDEISLREIGEYLENLTKLILERVPQLPEEIEQKGELGDSAKLSLEEIMGSQKWGG